MDFSLFEQDEMHISDFFYSGFCSPVLLLLSISLKSYSNIYCYINWEKKIVDLSLPNKFGARITSSS